MVQFYAHEISIDGFGAQYQRVIQTYIYCKKHNLNFCYNPFHFIEHNYNNDDEYINKLENLINLKNNIINLNSTMKVEHLEFFNIVMKYTEANVDICCESQELKFVKECFWENKNRNYFNNGKLNISIHIRRENSHDKGQAGERAITSNSYYLNVMNTIREKYKENDKELLFHIYSQGDDSQFVDIENPDVKMYLNYDIIESFLGMASADILITSPSSLSYAAALISDGEIYYKKFWHNPRKDWIICG
jgi:hypothetical protein